MRSPQTTGDDQPLPGISAFQTTLRVALQVSGSPGSSATPVDCGPRNCGQESAAPSGSLSRRTVKASAGVRITSTLLPRGTLERPGSRKFSRNVSDRSSYMRGGHATRVAALHSKNRDPDD